MTFKMLKTQIAETLDFQIFRNVQFIQLIFEKYLSSKLLNRYDKKKQKRN